VDDIGFEKRDVEIFKIPDIKTRLGTLQNYFFPRLEALITTAMEEVRVVYDINPFERTTFVYKPSHRLDAKSNFDVDEVFVGISGKRRTDRPLTILREDGSAFSYHSTYLTFNITLNGEMFVELRPFRQLVDKGYLDRAGKVIGDNEKLLAPILAQHHIAWTRAEEFLGLADSFLVGDPNERRGNCLISPAYDLPLSLTWGLNPLIGAFVALYPLVESLVAIAEGDAPNLKVRLDHYREFMQELELESVGDESDSEEESESNDISMPALDSYTFTRAGRWWNVIARDKWSCCSCGRSTKEHGVLLEIDHIVPRSKGGSDDEDNLQTLCKKCNIGKSNRDSTDLRA